MGPHHVVQCAGLGRDAADVAAARVACFTVACAFRFDHREHAQIRPFLGRGQAFQLGERPAATNRQTTMILFHRFAIGVCRRMAGVFGARGSRSMRLV